MLASLKNEEVSYLNVFYKWTKCKYFNLLTDVVKEFVYNGVLYSFTDRKEIII